MRSWKVDRQAGNQESEEPGYIPRLLCVKCNRGQFSLLEPLPLSSKSSVWGESMSHINTNTPVSCSIHLLNATMKPSVCLPTSRWGSACATFCECMGVARSLAPAQSMAV